jgi:glycosyltransferase involved in cell wall biosynthesis
LGCANKGNDLKEIVNKAKAGIVVDSNSTDELFEAAKILVDSEFERKKMGSNGRKLLSDQFSVENACIRIEKALKR